MIRWWKSVVREYFTFESREKRGILALLFLMILLITLPSFVRLFYREPAHDFERFKAAIDSFEATVGESSEQESQASFDGFDRELDSNPEGDIIASEPFDFDPNTASEEELLRLGLSKQATKAILNYRSKGGSFRKKEDLRKIYGLNDEQYSRLEPFIQIEVLDHAISESQPSTIKESKIERNTSLVDLNTADSATLVSLPGIGPVLSSRIVKFREKLGGYYSIEQLNEVYGLKPETFALVQTRVFANPDGVRKLPINQVDLAQLKSHPYFKDIAVPIVNYRDQHGAFKSTADLESVGVISPEVLKKISNYLEF